MKNIFAAICVIAISFTSISCREQEEILTSSEIQSLRILEQATDEGGTTTVAPAELDAADSVPIPPPKR